jgi:uncharacterized protein (TIGR02687 family)
MPLHKEGVTMELIEKLKEKFQDSTYRNIVFWYDSKGDRDIEELKSELGKLNIKFWELKENNSFETRYQLEVIDKESDYLIYGKFHKPNDKENQLIDILLYSKEFSADDVALIIDRYNLHHLNIREFIKDNLKFFNEKKRCQRLQDILSSKPNEDELVLGILCVLGGSTTLSVNDLVKVILKKGLDENNNEALKNINNFFDINVFWNKVYTHFGVMSKERNLETLINTIAYSYFTTNINFNLPKKYKYIYESSVTNICNIFLEDLIKENDNTSEIVDRINYLEVQWDIEDILNEQAYLSYYNCFAFKCIDKILITKLMEEINSDICNYSVWKDILNYREQSIWNTDEKIKQSYRILNIGLELYNEKIKFNSMHIPNIAYDLANVYAKEIYKIDKIYRNLIINFINANRPEVLSSLVENLSDWYNNYYMDKLSVSTDYVIDNELSNNWNINKFHMQMNFYDDNIKPLINNTTEKIYVIISDAFRYECAKELEEILDLRLNSEVNVTPTLGVIPSYTQLGMASLLPGNKITIDNKGIVYKNGISTSGLENRNKIINKYVENSVALSLQEFISLRGVDGQEKVKDKRLVYLYHDRIDAAGDSFKSEAYTYEVVNDAIKEIKDAISKLVGSYGAVRVFVTSDHGFIYQSEKVDERYKAIGVDGEIYDSTRRFVIGKNLTVPEGAKKMNLDYLGIDTECVITSGLNRFKTKGGGLRFVHGGAMPQEVIVPVLCYREIRGKKRKKEEQKVSVTVNNQSAITNHKYKVNLFQEQKVDSNYSDRTLNIAFYQEEERISNEVTLTFNSNEEASDRIKDVVFSLQEKPYQIGEDITLRFKDIDENIIYKEIEYEIKIYDVLS